MTNTFQSRAEAVSERLGGLGLGRIEVSSLPDLVDMDSQVQVHVDAVRDAETVPDIDDLARRVVAGSLKPTTAVSRLSSAASLKNAGGRSRLDALVTATRRAAVAAVDRDEIAPSALRRAVVPEVRSRLEAKAAEMLATMEQCPSTVLGHLTAVVEGQTGTSYGPLQSHQTAGALRFLSPDGDLSKVRGSDLQATQELMAAWDWVHGDAALIFETLFWVGTGQDVQRTYMNELAGAGADEAENFHPAMLLVGGKDVDYIAAGIPIAWLVASGTLTEFDVLADPYNEHAEAYNERVERAEAFRNWRDEGRNTVTAGAGNLMPRDELVKLQARAGGSKLSQVERFRSGVEK